VFHGFGQAKFPDGGLILCSSQFLILPQLHAKIIFGSKVVKIQPKIITLHITPPRHMHAYHLLSLLFSQTTLPLRPFKKASLCYNWTKYLVFIKRTSFSERFAQDVTGETRGEWPTCEARAPLLYGWISPRISWAVFVPRDLHFTGAPCYSWSWNLLFLLFADAIMR